MADHPRRLFSEIMATGLEKTMDEAECSIFSDSRKNLAAAFKKSVTNVEAGEEHMKCYLRIRPFSEDERDKGEDQECLEILDDNTVMTKAPKESHSFKNHAHGLGKTSHKFTFSRIFDEETSQKEFFDDTMLGLVRDFIDGQNCLVFTYGVTSSGKTYTIQGKQSDAGILPRALDVLFNSINNKQWSGMNLKPKMFMDVTKLTTEQEDAEKKIKERIMKMSTEDDSNVMMLLGDDASDMSQGNTTTCSEGSNISTVNDREQKDSLDGDIFTDIENRIREETKVSVEDQGQIKFSIWCSFAEIYNEQIFDLLEPLPKKKNAKRPVLRLSDDKNGSPYIKGLKEVNVFNADEAYKLLNIGQRNLRTACTKLNHNSSRSHCIFNIKIIRVLDNGNPRMARVSMLSLCDLAGSERSSKTLSQGERLKEAGNINTSLMTLGRCIEMLRYNQNHKENGRIIPFRDSKLTRLFQNFFCGRGKAAMIVNVNQCASMFDETFHVFKFSAIAKQLVVHQKPEVKKAICMPTRATRARDPSIMWDTPGAMMKYNSQFARDEEDDDEEEDGLDVSMSELQEALNLVELLQNQLAEEKRSRVLMEARVRDEVCKEMMQQIVSIEENYNEMLRETKIQQEEMVEERVKMLMQSIHRPRKRLRGDKCDENTDEWVPIIRFQAEEIKVKELTLRLESMTKEIATLKAEMKQMTKTNETMTKAKTSLEFQIADSKSTITELLTMKEQFESRQKVVERENKDNTKVIDDLKLQLQQALASRGQSDDVGSSVLLETLSQQLQEAKDTIRQQEKDIEELNEMLTEAGETFNQKDEEIVKLKIAMSEDEEKIVQQAEMITQMQTMLEESKMAVENSQQRLQDKDAKLAELDAACSDKQEMIEKLTKQLKRLESVACDDMEKSRIEERENLQKVEAEMEKLNEVLIDKEAEIVTLNDKLKKEEEESFKRHQALIHGYNAEMNIYKSQNLELRAKLAGFKKTDDELEKTKEQAKSFKNDLLDQVKELQDELMKNSAMTAELERGLTIAKSSVEDLEKRLEVETRKHAEAKKVIGDFDSKLKKITEEKDEKILHHKKNARTLRGEVNDLKDTLKAKENDLENIKFRFAELEIAQEKTVEDKTKVAEELDRLKELVREKDKCLDVQAGENESLTKMNEELERLKKLVDEKDKSMDVQSEKMEELNKLQEELDVLKKKEDSLSKTIREKDEVIDEMKKEEEELKKKINESTTMADKGKEEVKALKEEMKEVKDSLKSKEEEITKLEEKMEELETVKSGLQDMVNQTTGDLENKTVQLKSLEAKTEDLNKLTCLEKQLTGEISNLNLQIEEKNKNIRKIEKDLEKRNKAFDKLKKELDEQTLLIEEKNKAVKEFEKDIESKTSDNEKLKKELDNQNSLLEAKDNAIKELQKNLESKNGDSEKVNTELDSKSSEIKKLNSKISDQAEKIGQLNEKIAEESKNSSSREQKITELTETISQQTQLLEHKITEIDTLRGELEDRVSECENLNFKLTTAQTELGDIRVVLEGLREQETTQHEQTQTEVAEVNRQKQEVCEKLTSAETREKDLLKHEEELQEKLKSCELKEKDLLEENESLKSEVKSAEVKLKELLDEKEDSKKSADCLKEEKIKLCAEIKTHEVEITRLSKQIEKLQHDLEEKSSQLEEVQASYSEMKNTLSRNDADSKKLADAHLEIAELKSALHMEKTLHKKYKAEVDNMSDENKDLQSRLSKKNNELDLLKTEEANFEKEIIKLSGKLKEEKSSRQEAIEKLQLIQNENKKERLSTSETLATKDGEIRQLSKELEGLKTVFSEAQQECSDLAERNADLVSDSKKLKEELKSNKKQDGDSNVCQQLREELEREQTRCIKLEASIKEFQESETDTTPGNARRLRKEKIQAESSLINAEFEIEKLTKKVQAMERGETRISTPQTDRKTLEKLVLKDKEIEKLSEQVKNLESKVSSLSSELKNVEKHSSDSSSINKEIEELKAELKEKEQKICELSRKRSTESLKMSEDSLQELKKSQDRELNLRQQLKEAGETMKEQNKEISDLEEKVQHKLTEFLEMESKVKRLEKEKDDLMSQTSASRVHEDKIQELRSEIERKNQKLESKHKTNTELRQTLTVEREKFEVALKDAQANEAVLESLKDALSEQEDTMAKQDEILKKREDEIKLLNTELEKLMTKYQNLLDSTGDSGRELRELTKSNTRLESEKKELEKDKKSLKEELEKHDKTIQDSENRITELTNQISALRTNKEKMDSKIEKSAEEMTQFMKELERLKTEKVDLEKLVCVNKNRSSNLEEILSAKSTLEGEKCKLEKERDELLKEKEKLVSDKTTLNNVVKENNEDILELEKVLTESRQQVEELKCKLDEQVKEKVNNDKQETKNLVEELKSRLRDKDSEIRKLQKESDKMNSDISAMKTKVSDKEKEMETWRKSRDDLVGSLESLMKKQAAEIKDLKEERLNHNRKEMLNLLEEKDEKIRELEEQLDAAEVEVKVQTPTRGRCRKRSNIAGISIVEIDNMRKQLEQEREEKLIMQRNLQMMQKAKDSIISDMRASNHLLQVEIAQLQGVQPPPTPPPPTPPIKTEPIFEEEDEDISEHLQLDATPTVAAKALRKGRKRVSATPDADQAPKTRRRGRPVTKVKQDQEEPASDLVEIKEEEEESDTGRRPGRRAKKAAKEALSTISSPLTRSAKNTQPVEMPETPSESESKLRGRKKRVLYNSEEIHITPPFECGAFVPSNITPDSKPNTRQLRGRKQSAV